MGGGAGNCGANIGAIGCGASTGTGCGCTNGGGGGTFSPN